MLAIMVWAAKAYYSSDFVYFAVNSPRCSGIVEIRCVHQLLEQLAQYHFVLFVVLGL